MNRYLPSCESVIRPFERIDCIGALGIDMPYLSLKSCTTIPISTTVYSFFSIKVAIKGRNVER